MLTKIITVITILSGGLILAFLNFTTPALVGPFGVLLFFILVYLFFLGIFTWLVRAISYIVFSIGKSKVLSKPVKQVSVKKAYYYGSVLALAPVLLIAAQSLGGMGFIEFVLIVVFVVLTCFLLSKR